MAVSLSASNDHSVKERNKNSSAILCKRIVPFSLSQGNGFDKEMLVIVRGMDHAVSAHNDLTRS